MFRRLILTLGFSTLLVALLSAFFFKILCIGISQVKSDELGKFNYLISDSTYYNTIFIGSSTIHVALYPELLDSITGYHSFNGGLTGVQITEVNLIVKKYIQSHGPPLRLFINIDEASLGTENGVFRFPQYFAYINDPDFSLLSDFEPRLYYGEYIPSLAISYMDDDLKDHSISQLLNSKLNYNILSSGFSTIKNGLQFDLPLIQPHFRVSNKGWDLLQETISYASHKNISTYLLLMPRYKYVMTDSFDSFNSRIKSLESRYDVKVIDMSNDPRFQAKDLFSDRIHLNTKGAYLYTRILAQKLQNQ